MTIPFVREDRHPYGEVIQLSEQVQRIFAHNPSPFTYTGTGTVFVGKDAVAVIDPGPKLDEHIDALMATLGGRPVSHILVTHTHIDHSPAARPFAERTGAPIYAFGPHAGGHAGAADTAEEGADTAFMPDVRLADGERISGDGWTLRTVHTPGHASNHLCFALEEEATLFSGDHIMGWSTSVISPPDGNMSDYLASLAKVREMGFEVLRPTHGPAITDPEPFIDALIAHREAREAAVLAALDAGPRSAADIVPGLYRDVPAHLHRAAAHSVYAHLLRLVDIGRAECDGPPALTATFRLANL